ncbi:hypothetical protein QVD17_34276 [Tagetes erecta]|uniref:Uncharacterized protein n=1 Tax=Tagetes erecta TaxID=13708 RepID=A0AAD8JXN9_TARER|nr:hypothetical protein QVD17_34276 [Tagetes erecta]
MSADVVRRLQTFSCRKNKQHLSLFNLLMLTSHHLKSLLQSNSCFKIHQTPLKKNHQSIQDLKPPLQPKS